MIRALPIFALLLGVLRTSGSGPVKITKSGGAAASAADPYALTSTTPPCPFALSSTMDGVALANAAVHELAQEGRLYEAAACNEMLLVDGGRALPEAAREAVAGNLKSLRVTLGPWFPGVARLFHNFAGLEAGFPHSDAPLVKGQVDRAIQVWDGAFNEAQCASIIELFERSELYEGNVISNGAVVMKPDHKKAYEFDVSGTRDSLEWARVDRALSSLTIKYLGLYEDANPVVRGMRNPLSDEGFRIKRYRAGMGEHHAYHSDSGQEARGAPTRVIAVLIYLSAVEPGGGGETVFLNQGRTVAPRCGRVLFFPAAFPYVHAGRRVTNGTKYVVAAMVTL